MPDSQQSMHVKVLDGGLGMELEKIDGYDVAAHPLWSAYFLKEDPGVIKNIHKQFLLAGSDALITSSYQANIENWMKYCETSREKAGELMQLSVDIAKQAISEVQALMKSNKTYYVAASVGPFGACLHDLSEYNGNYVDTMSLQDLKDWHRERMGLLLSRKPDFLAIETMPAEKEVLALTELLREFPEAKAWVTFTCKDDTHTFHNDVFKQAVEKVLRSPQISSIGVNCCSPEIVDPLLRSIKDLLPPDKTLIAYPNKGIASADDRLSPTKKEKDLSKFIPKWLEISGIEWIGGCCSTSPKDISDISRVIQEWNTNSCSKP